MGFLASLLPGLRELRAPLISGLLWLAVLYINFSLHLGATPTHTLAPLVNAWGGAVVPAIVIGLAYLIGDVARSIVTPPLYWLGQAMRKAGLRLTSHEDLSQLVDDKHGRLISRRRPLWLFKAIERFDLRTWPFSLTARSLLLDAVKSRLSKAGISGTAALMFPYEAAIDALPHSAAQLSQTAPIVYQEYDRLRAEADLRLAVPIPLIALASSIQISGKVGVVAASVAVATVLLLRAIDNLRSANDILANSAYLNYVSIPIVESVAEAVGALDTTPVSDGQWIGAIIVSLSDKGFFEELDMAFDEALELDQSKDRKEVRQYLGEHSPDLAERWDRRMRES
jgi:hypothetical protein